MLASRSGRRLCNGLLQDDVSVRAADPEGADTGAPRTLASRPHGFLAVHVKWRIVEIDPRIGSGKIDAWRQAASMERQCRFHQSDNAGSCIEVSDIGFDRTNGARIARP